MQKLNISEAKTHFSQLVDKAGNGESFVIARSGKPVAKLGPLEPPAGNRFRFGTMAGQIKVSDDFNEPLSDEILEEFENGR
jgi:prevent-host-death family protein